MLKAIETRYSGYRFRSRLEARWAVFFDRIGQPWEYEIEGFDLGIAGRYLPDFYFPQHDFRLWVEIKGGTPSIEEVNKAKTLAEQGKGLVVIDCGTPGEEQIYMCDRTEILTPETTFGDPVWCSIFHRHPHGEQRPCFVIRRAYEAARSARFEHGERP